MGSKLSAMEAPELEITVGPEPDNSDVEVGISHEGVESGCYVECAESQRRTALVHDWCIQWAERGLGFCYVHPRGPASQELIARLPADRLDDVVWIDYQRIPLTDYLDVPPVARVAVDPFELSAADIDTDALETDPAIGRCANWLAAASASTKYFDWNVARVIETLLPPLIDEEGSDYWDLGMELSVASTETDPSRLFEFVDSPAAEQRLEQAYADDSKVFLKAAQCLQSPLEAYVFNPLIGAQTYDIGGVITNSDIVLITGHLSEPTPEWFHSPELIGSHLLIQTLVRQLWERAQTASADATPLVLDGITTLSPPHDFLIPKLTRDAHQTPLVPILTGPYIGELPERLKTPIERHAGTHVRYTDRIGADLPEPPKGDIDAMRRFNEGKQILPSEADYCCSISTEKRDHVIVHPSMLTRAARPSVPPRFRHDAPTVANTITDSITRHGRVNPHLSEETIHNAREQ